MSRDQLMFPQDRTPCTICNLAPRVYRPTPAERLYVCARCGAPYVVRLDDRGRLVEPPACTLPRFAIEPMRAYWKATRANVAPGTGIPKVQLTDADREQVDRVGGWLAENTPQIEDGMLEDFAQSLAQALARACTQHGADFVLWITAQSHQWSTYVSSLADHEATAQALRECAETIEAALDVVPEQRPGTRPATARFTTVVRARLDGETRLEVACNGAPVGLLTLPDAAADSLIWLLHRERAKTEEPTTPAPWQRERRQ